MTRRFTLRMLGLRALFANLNPVVVKNVITAMFMILCGFIALSAIMPRRCPGFCAISSKDDPPSLLIPGTTSPSTKLIRFVPANSLVAIDPTAMDSATFSKLVVGGFLLRAGFFLRAITADHR